MFIESIEARSQEGAEVRIGVVGATGSRKSSLINALLDESVVQSNCMKACTSVIVEIRGNTSLNTAEKYTADVQYITPQEWDSEFENLKQDIINGLEDDRLGDAQSPEAKEARDKLEAIYPGVPVEELLNMTADQLCKARDLSKILGRPYQSANLLLKCFPTQSAVLLVAQMKPITQHVGL
jgi:ATPase subunit of ABC transporter with duplicated ATPase domains